MGLYQNQDNKCVGFVGYPSKNNLIDVVQIRKIRMAPSDNREVEATIDFPVDEVEVCVGLQPEGLSRLISSKEPHFSTLCPTKA